VQDSSVAVVSGKHRGGGGGGIGGGGGRCLLPLPSNPLSLKLICWGRTQSTPCGIQWELPRAVSSKSLLGEPATVSALALSDGSIGDGPNWTCAKHHLCPPLTMMPSSQPSSDRSKPPNRLHMVPVGDSRIRRNTRTRIRSSLRTWGTREPRKVVFLLKRCERLYTCPRPPFYRETKRLLHSHIAL
jgi:hypothetical protein